MIDELSDIQARPLSCRFPGVASCERPPGIWEVRLAPGLDRIACESCDGTSQRAKQESESLHHLTNYLDTSQRAKYEAEILHHLANYLDQSLQTPQLQCSGEKVSRGLSVINLPDTSNDTAVECEGRPRSSASKGKRVSFASLEQHQECIYFARGQCTRGVACPFAHGPEDSPDSDSTMPDDYGHPQRSGITKSLKTDGATTELATDEPRCKWHHSAKLVGKVSEDGHVFTKVSGADRQQALESGDIFKLGPMCMVFDEHVRSGGTICYHYRVLNGEIGFGDGAGFAFDSKARRCNLQRMRSIFLNNRGHIYFRNQRQVRKLNVSLPRVEVGMRLVLTVDLPRMCFHFHLLYADGSRNGEAHVLPGMLPEICQCDDKLWQTGYFFALLTKSTSVCLE